jgi:hypothetical protein
MSTTRTMSALSAVGERRTGPMSRARWCRTLLASTAALSLGMQDVAWATCSDGSTLPSDGFVIGRDAPVKMAANWSPNVFTAPTGSLFIPDNSVHENNDPAKPLTHSGHNWVFDQGSTLCKMTDLGSGSAVATGWAIPPNNPTDCVILPVIKNGTVTNLGDIPFQGSVITPTCDPTILSTHAPNPANTYFNQLGCAISHGKATTPQNATSWLFVAGVKGGMFSVRLDNVTNPVKGGEAGKTVGPQNYYSAIPEGSKLTSAAVNANGRFAVATSSKRLQAVYACFNPLGDPGDWTKPINPNFFVPPASQVPCMQVGSNNLPQDSTTDFGPDGQPYFGGRRVIMSFDSQPGGASRSAWPNCIYQNSGITGTTLDQAFANPLTFANGCGLAQPNFGFTSGLVTEPAALISHGDYMYTGPLGGTIMQFKISLDPVSRLTQYKFRTLVTGLSLNTGLGIAMDLQSLMIYTDPSAIGLAGQAVVTKIPLCEDM